MTLTTAAVRQRQHDNLLSAGAFLASHAELVVVGGCALRLHGIEHVTKDLDVVPEPSPANLRRLFDAIAILGTVDRVPRPTDHRLATADILRRVTPIGEIDVLLRRGREEYRRFARHATPVPVDDRPVSVASLRDVLEFRERFGKAPIHG